MKLDVSHIRQERQNNCWHASGRMLYGYRNRASTHPLSGRYAADHGITADQFIELAAEMGLLTLPQVNQSFSWQFINDALQRYGPIWAAGQWNGANHIVVITGVDADDTLYVNDPAFGSPVVRNMAWFKARIDKNVAVPMMYLPSN